MAGVSGTNFLGMFLLKNAYCLVPQFNIQLVYKTTLSFTQIHFFDQENMKKTPSKVRLDYLETFSLTAQPAQTARTVKFMVSNVAYRATVYKAGPSTVHFFVFGLPNMLCT